uniref:Galectin n=1 Tax=Cyprinodon variegatus TaxID=28743 RepID=A0A3Q2CJJ3_CYPVA
QMLHMSSQLADALGDNQSAGPWPSNPAWPGQPAPNPTWPGGQPASNPAWPGGQPASNPAWPGGQPASNPAWPGGQPASNPTWPGGPSGGNSMWPVVPYDELLPHGVYDKLLITITGTVKPNADKFTVNLSTPKDVAFHFNPRFNDYGQKVLVRNTCVNNIWGKEEREVQKFPFVPGQPFQMKILCTNKEFRVAVNNSHLLAYQHRVKELQSINKLSILYDVTLSGVEVEKLP